MTIAKEECVQYNLKEIVDIASNSYYSYSVSRAGKIVWFESDVILPLIDVDSYHLMINKIITNLKLDIRYAITLTNLIDSIVGGILEESSKFMADQLKGCSFYDQLRLYLTYQEASELTHQIVYKKQFNALVPHQDRDKYINSVRELLHPLTNVLNHHTGVLLATLIESILIPLIFSVIDEFRDLPSTMHLDKLTKEILAMVIAANKFIFRDELTHIEVGLHFIRDLKHYALKNPLNELDKMLNLVDQVATDFIVNCVDSSALDKIQLYMDRKNTLIEIIKNKLLNLDNITMNNYLELPFIRADKPSLEGFFRGSYTSYLTATKYIPTDKIYI